MDSTKKIVIDILLRTATGRNRLQGVFEFIKGREDWDIRLPQTKAELETALAEDVDGIIISRVYSNRILRRLERGKTPVVFMDIDKKDRLHHRDVDVTIMNDNGGIGIMAGKYLASLGRFRSFGYVPSKNNEHWSVRRGQGYAAALRELGHSVNFFKYDKEKLHAWIKRLPKPTAIFCAWDSISRTTLEACRRVRVKVPEQAVILGVDNDELICQLTKPELSSIRQDTLREGFEAAKLLHALMKRDKACKSRTQLIKPLEIVERASTNPPPPAAHIVQLALDFIRQNATKGISADDVARHVRCSRRLLDLRFSHYHSESAHDAIVHTRLDAVCRELRGSNRKLIHVAKECGFKNANVLRNLFRKTFGMSMREWRRRHSADDVAKSPQTFVLAAAASFPAASQTLSKRSLRR